jgi:hypothetical protein
MRCHRPLLALLLVLVSGATPAFAQEDEASRESKAHYQKGRTAYDLGRFDEAVKEFEKAYELKPDAAYIFNLAQTYKQKGDHQKAVFYYRRYLTLSPQAKNREAIEARIAELEDLIKKQADQKEKPPDGLNPPENPDGPRPDGPVPRDPAMPRDPDGTGTDVSVTAPARPTKVRLSVAAGPAFVSLGDGPTVPAQVSVFAQGAYTVNLAKLQVELGAAFGLTPIPYNTVDQTATGTSLLMSGLALVGVRYEVARRVGLRGEIGVGVQSMGGLKEGNPFTDENRESSAVTMLNVRAAVGVDFRVAGGFLITVMPACFSFSPGAKRLDDPIDRITRFELLVGVGYAL